MAGPRGTLRIFGAASAARFLLVGASNFVVSFTAFRLLLLVPVDVPYRAGAAQLGAYGAGILWSYVWNRRYTFRSRTARGPQFTRFVILQVALAFGTAAAIEAVVARGVLDPSAAWFAVMAPATVANFLLCRFWVFVPNGEVDHAAR